MYGFNNQYQQGYGAPYMGQYGQASQQACQITRVNGRNGADAFRMAPNSSILLLDENDPIVWLKVSDGGGVLYCYPVQHCALSRPREGRCYQFGRARKKIGGNAKCQIR